MSIPDFPGALTSRNMQTGMRSLASASRAYHTLAELDGLKGAERSQHMRIGGTVEEGSIHRMTGRVDFVLEGEGKALSVSYVGSDPLPDTFVDKSQALIEGKPTAEGRFVADHVQAKCASKYEAAPGGPNTTPSDQPKTAPKS